MFLENDQPFCLWEEYRFGFDVVGCPPSLAVDEEEGERPLPGLFLAPPPPLSLLLLADSADSPLPLPLLAVAAADDGPCGVDLDADVGLALEGDPSTDWPSLPTFFSWSSCCCFCCCCCCCFWRRFSRGSITVIPPLPGLGGANLVLVGVVGDLSPAPALALLPLNPPLLPPPPPTRW